MAKNQRKTGLGIEKAVQEVRENFDKKKTTNEDIVAMKVVELNVNTLIEYVDNEEVFGDLKGREFEELCDSIRDRGILQPVIVRPKGDQYEVLAGHQRRRAVIELNQFKIPAIIKNVDDIEARLIWLETNIRSRHMTPDRLGKALDEAYRLYEVKRSNGDIEFKGKTSHMLAEKFDMSPRSVEELIMITRKVAESVQKLDIKKSSMAHMAKLDKSEQEALLTLLGEDTIQNLTANEVQKAVETMKEEMKNLDISYKSELETTQTELTKKEKELNNINETFNTMKENVGDLTSKNEEIEKQIDEEKKKRIELEQKLENADVKDKEELEKQIEEKTKEIDNMLGESLKLLDQVKELDEKMKDILEEKKMVQENLDNLEDDYKQLYEDNRKKIAENEELKKKLEEASKPPADYEDLKSELKQLKENDKVESTLNKAIQELGRVHILVTGLEKLQAQNHLDMKSRMVNMVEAIKKQLDNM